MEISLLSFFNKELNLLGFKVFIVWCVVFIIEVILIFLGNFYVIVFFIRGCFNFVRYFVISLLFMDIFRGLVVIVIFLGLL